MQLIVDMVPIDHHQVEGQVTHEAIGAPLPFCGWLDFVRVLEVVLSRSGESAGPPGPTTASSSSTPVSVRADQPPAA